MDKTIADKVDAFIGKLQRGDGWKPPAIRLYMVLRGTRNEYLVGVCDKCVTENERPISLSRNFRVERGRAEFTVRCFTCGRSNLDDAP